MPSPCSVESARRYSSEGRSIRKLNFELPAHAWVLAQKQLRDTPGSRCAQRTLCCIRNRRSCCVCATNETSRLSINPQEAGPPEHRRKWVWPLYASARDVTGASVAAVGLLLPFDALRWRRLVSVAQAGAVGALASREMVSAGRAVRELAAAGRGSWSPRSGSRSILVPFARRPWAGFGTPGPSQSLGGGHAGRTRPGLFWAAPPQRAWSGLCGAAGGGQAPPLLSLRDKHGPLPRLPKFSESRSPN